MCLVVHPDKGGEALDFQELRAAYESWVSSQNNEPDQPAPNTSGETPGASPASHFPGPLADVEDGSVSGARGGNVACGDGARAVCVDEGVTPPSTLRNHNLAVLLTNSLGNVSVAVWLQCAASNMSMLLCAPKSVL